MKHILLASQWLIAVAATGVFAGAGPATSQPADVYQNDFRHGIDDFVIEQEQPAAVTAKDGILTFDAPAGLTVWLKQKLTSPVTIEYDATVIQNHGPNDRLSDLNCFWMAADPTHPADPPFAHPRSGKFADYDTLTTYYVGYGGNSNTTTRFRRYIGEKSNRPLRPEDDLRDAAHLLQPNTPVHIKLVANGHTIEFWRNGERVFFLDDPSPYTAGWFAFRTVKSHIEIRNFRISG